MAINDKFYVWVNNVLLGLLGSTLFIIYYANAKEVEKHREAIIELQIEIRLLKEKCK